MKQSMMKKEEKWMNDQWKWIKIDSIEKANAVDKMIKKWLKI